MWELRWVLVGLGAALILGVYLWGRGTLQRFVPKAKPIKLWLPRTDAEDPWAPASAAAEESAPVADAQARLETPQPPGLPERVITIRFVSKDKELGSEKVILALRAAGLQHGRYGIFHRVGEGGSDDPVFSVANLTEPGSFDLSRLSQSTIPGMSFFMVLPGPGDPVARFDLMVETARSLAHDLNAELHDEKGSSWSIQRERYLREELIEYRHQRERV
jgi:cell division protein ZipA